MRTHCGIWQIALLSACVAAVGFSGVAAGADKPKTLAYDGFNTGTGAGSYRANQRPYGNAPTLGTAGFDDRNAWDASTSHFYPRPKFIRELSHNLLAGTQPGCLGHWVFNGVRTIHRNLPKAPEAKSGTYTLCLLVCAWDEPKFNNEDSSNHTTGTKGTYGMIGFTPDSPIPGHKSTTAEFGDNGKRGLCLGYYENNLRVFAGGKSFNIVEGYKENTTYLLMAEMTVKADGPEYIRAFYAASGDKELTPAKFNSENGGKGVEVETWTGPADMLEMELYMSDCNKWIPGKQHYADPMSSPFDKKKTDFITWDEVRLLDGMAAVPVPADEGDTSTGQAPITKKTLPAKLAAYWAFDEGSGQTAKDAVSGADGRLLRSAWVKDGVFGSAMHFTAKGGPKYGPHLAGMVSIPHEKVLKTDLPWERYHRLTFTAWVRGGEDFKGIADIITKANGAKVEERQFADIKGIGFMIVVNKLELELVNSINWPQPDMRIKVQSNLKVPGDGKWHHVAVTYDGSSKPAGVTFYVDGVKDTGFSFNFADMKNQPKELTADIGTLSPYCIGGRDCKDEKDGVSASGANYGMTGDADEVGVFSYDLEPGCVIAIHGLATADGLKYNLAQVNQLIELHKAGKGAAKIGDKTWQYVPGGLTSELGKVTADGGKFAVRLGLGGSGVRTK